MTGKVQNYAWGGKAFIPELLGTEPSEKPVAEYWMGAHPSAPSTVENASGSALLNEVIAQDPNGTLTHKTAEHFGGLPYLFKVLDVNDMLSIQVHPTKKEAEKGFDAEEAAGLPINAPHRNYKDRNHKPEVMVALSDFWLLHGFKPHRLLEDTLTVTKEFNVLLPLYKKEGVKGLYRFVMEMPQEEIDALLLPVIKREIRAKNNGQLGKGQPGWWVTKLYPSEPTVHNIDKGVFSIYFFNIVNARPGQAVFQGAGIPHAYLEGQNVELMANSDNVLRGGLTPKHIDVPELLKHTLFEPIVPNVMNGTPIGDMETLYPSPVPDFGISKISLQEKNYQGRSASLEILLATEGEAHFISSNGTFDLSKGHAVAVLPGEPYSIEPFEKTVVYKAFVP